MTLSLVPFPPFSRSLARFITSARGSLPLPGDRELYLIPVVILAEFGRFPPALTSSEGDLHLPAGWGRGIGSGALYRCSPTNACVGASRRFASAGLVRDWCGTGAGLPGSAGVIRLRAAFKDNQPVQPRRLGDAPPLSSAALVAQVSAATLAYINTDESGPDFQNKTGHQSPRCSSEKVSREPR